MGSRHSLVEDLATQFTEILKASIWEWLLTTVPTHLPSFPFLLLFCHKRRNAPPLLKPFPPHLLRHPSPSADSRAFQLLCLPPTLSMPRHFFSLTHFYLLTCREGGGTTVVLFSSFVRSLVDSYTCPDWGLDPQLGVSGRHRKQPT